MQRNAKGVRVFTARAPAVGLHTWPCPLTLPAMFAHGDGDTTILERAYADLRGRRTQAKGLALFRAAAPVAVKVLMEQGTQREADALAALRVLAAGLQVVREAVAHQGPLAVPVDADAILRGVLPALVTHGVHSDEVACHGLQCVRDVMGLFLQATRSAGRGHGHHFLPSKLVAIVHTIIVVLEAARGPHAGLLAALCDTWATAVQGTWAQACHVLGAVLAACRTILHRPDSPPSMVHPVLQCLCAFLGEASQATYAHLAAVADLVRDALTLHGHVGGVLARCLVLLQGLVARHPACVWAVLPAVGAALSGASTVHESHVRRALARILKMGVGDPDPAERARWVRAAGEYLLHHRPVFRSTECRLLVACARPGEAAAALLGTDTCAVLLAKLRARFAVAVLSRKTCSAALQWLQAGSDVAPVGVSAHRDRRHDPPAADG
jgi:hypothetical protein